MRHEDRTKLQKCMSHMTAGDEGASGTPECKQLKDATIAKINNEYLTDKQKLSAMKFSPYGMY